MYTYLWINFFTIIIPFLWSFENKIQFYKKWKALFPALIGTALFFIVWDMLFTYWGIWGFNDRYLSGLEIINLPLGEWLFFITIPYACVFTYEALKYLVRKDYFGSYQRIITWILIIFLGAVALFNMDRTYTSTTFLFLTIFLLMHIFWFKSTYLGRFYFSYIILLIPFFIVNGILTGSWIEEEVVWYNNNENLGIRLGTIPVEDIFYGMLLILINVTIFEKLQERFFKKQTIAK